MRDEEISNKVLDLQITHKIIPLQDCSRSDLSAGESADRC
jgi:hypothetical protein